MFFGGGGGSMLENNGYIYSAFFVVYSFLGGPCCFVLSAAAKVGDAMCVCVFLFGESLVIAGRHLSEQIGGQFRRVKIAWLCV